MKDLSNTIWKFQKIEELANGNSSIHRLSPFAKLAMTVCFILTVVSFDPHDISGLLQFSLYPLLLIVFADLPFDIIQSTLLFALPFTLFTALTSLLLNQHPYGVIGPFVITYGMISGASLLIKCTLTVSAVTAMMATTRLLDLCLVLRALRVPNLFILQFLLCFRYISVLLKEAKRMALAYQLRNPKQKGIRFHHAGGLIGQLLLKSYYRADRIYTAMQCRGFQRSLQLSRPPMCRQADIICAVAICALILSGRFFNLAQWIESLLR